MKEEEPLLVIPYTLKLPFRYSAGCLLSHFYRELRDNARLVANRCPNCHRLLFPPQIVCGRCHVTAGEEWVELSGKGKVLDFIVVVEPLQDPTTGEVRKEKYPHATIMLDEGVTLTHYLAETDIEKLRIGMRVQAVFKERKERIGHMTDILYFKPIEQGDS